jgi:hypothetical protein
MSMLEEEEFTPRRRRRRKAASGNPSVPRTAFSIREFCESVGISVDLYYKLKRLGRGPREMKVGARTLISVESATEWRHNQEA